MPTLVDKILNSQSVQLGLAGLAFLIALWLVIVIARMLMGGRLRLPGGRTRQARLGIVDAFDLDRQRQLIIIRRDNTEHLIMIGGPNDLVIEPEIVRVEARDYRDTRRDKVVDGLPDLRIPAPVNAPTNEPQPQLNGGGTRSADPLFPMPSPQITPANIAGLAGETRPGALPEAPLSPPQQPRGPTFPLPPRRPTPAPPMQERRPAPPLPDRATRTDDPPPPPSLVDDQPALQPQAPLGATNVTSAPGHPPTRARSRNV